MRLPSSRTVPRLGSLIILSLLVGCLESTAEPVPTPIAPTDVVFASFLGIDLDAMTLSPSALYYSTIEEGEGVDIGCGRRYGGCAFHRMAAQWDSVR